jgi:hypothetical protein
MESPDYAPLPVSFWQHLKSKRVRVTTPHSIDTAALTDYQQQLNKASADLEHDMVVACRQAFASLNSLVQANTLTRPNMIALLNQHSLRSLSPTTLSRWRKRNLLHYADEQHINPHNAAAILVMRLLLPDEKYGWLPSTMAPNEPLWWCWRQDSPDSPIVPCPFPLPADVPEAARLWTSWQGAAWEKGHDPTTLSSTATVI